MFQIADRRLLIADFGCARAVVGSMSKPISKPQALQQRLISHAVVLLEISANLPHTPQATHVSRQLLRSGTAAAANYGEARGAESRSDFVHKLRIVLKELNETTVWLELIIESSLISREKMSPIVAENAELCRIIAASIRTAGGFERD
jgi:four helix bundle protein